MPVRIAYVGPVLLLASSLGLGSGCGDDDDGGKLGTLERSAVLGELSGSESRALCDISDRLADDAIADDEGVRATCFRQLIGDLEVGLLNADLSPERFPLDAIVEQCEAALDRCMEDGPMRQSCEAITFEPGCRTTVGDFGRCLEDVLTSARVYATTDCAKYVGSDGERERLGRAVAKGLASCPPVLSCKATTTPDGGVTTWFDGGVGEVTTGSSASRHTSRTPPARARGSATGSASRASPVAAVRSCC